MRSKAEQRLMEIVRLIDVAINKMSHLQSYKKVLIELNEQRDENEFLIRKLSELEELSASALPPTVVLKNFDRIMQETNTFIKKIRRDLNSDVQKNVR